MSARDEQVNFLVSKDEREQLVENAAWFGMTLSEYLRYAALGGTRERPTLRQRARRREEVAA